MNYSAGKCNVPWLVDDTEDMPSSVDAATDKEHQLLL